MSSTLISRRYETKSLLLTTNRPFSEWPQVFPNATCVISLIKRATWDHDRSLAVSDDEAYAMQRQGGRLPSRAMRPVRRTPLRSTPRPCAKKARFYLMDAALDWV